MLLKSFNLQLFADAEGASGAAPTEGAGGQVAADTGATAPAMQSNAEGSAEGQPSSPATDARLPWEQVRELYKDEIEADSLEYAKRYSKDVVSRRRAKDKAELEEYALVKPYLERELYRHGFKRGDVRAFVEKMGSDKSVFRERAMANGTTEEAEEAFYNALKEADDAKAELARRDARAYEEKRLGEIREGYKKIEADVKTIRELYDPDFDLAAARKSNAAFAKYSAEPHNTILDAYKMAYYDENMRKASERAASDAVMKAANAVRSGTFPEEAAAGPHNAPAKVTKDPSKLSLEEINQMIAESRRGIKHSFS